MRAFDLVVATVGLVVVAPLIAISALAVLIESGRPIFYRSIRVGLGGRDFRLLKVRTMRQDSEGPEITASGDPRVSKIGSILRTAKIDELPQLVNVIKGDMSLVGPRPEIRKYVEMFPQEFEILHTIRPGITGVASIAFRNESDLLAKADCAEDAYVSEVLPAKLALELDYVQKRSLGTNLRLLAKTVKAVVEG